MHHSSGLLPVCRQLPVCPGDVQDCVAAGGRHHQEQLLRHLLLHLPAGHGLQQQGLLMGQLSNPDCWKVVLCPSIHQ